MAHGSVRPPRSAVVCGEQEGGGGPSGALAVRPRLRTRPHGVQCKVKGSLTCVMTAPHTHSVLAHPMRLKPCTGVFVCAHVCIWCGCGLRPMPLTMHVGQSVVPQLLCTTHPPRPPRPLTPLGPRGKASHTCRSHGRGKPPRHKTRISNNSNKKQHLTTIDNRKPRGRGAAAANAQAASASEQPGRGPTLWSTRRPCRRCPTPEQTPCHRPGKRTQPRGAPAPSRRQPPPSQPAP
jgi:hypothetical protein